MTYMATITTLSGDGGPLIKVTVPLRRFEMEERQLYVFDCCVSWMKTKVPTMVTGNLKAQQTPSEQLDAILYKWISGKRFVYDRMFKDLSPAEDEVWELKTADLRIFGWMYRPKIFIGVLGDFADFYKEPNKTKFYSDAKNKVIAKRDLLDIDGPKFVEGATFDELVSI